MRKLLLIVFLVAAFVVPASATWTLVQQFISPANCTPGVLTCSISVSSTGSGNVIVVWIEINGVGAVPTTISAVTGGGTYTLGSTFGCNTFVSSHAIDCALTLSSTSGATTIAITRSNNTGAPQFKVGGGEWAFTNGPPVLDVVGTAIDNCGGSCTGTHIGPTISPTGANDLILQGAVTGPSLSSISSPYTAQFSDHFGIGYLLNSANGSPVTWTETSPQTGTAVMNAIAIREATVTSYNLSVTVTGNGTVTSSPAGISCPGTCSAPFAPTTAVTLTESPGTNYTFSTWGGDCSGSSSTCSITMNANHSATALFLSSSTKPALPNFIDNNELICAFTAQCQPNSPAITTQAFSFGTVGPYVFTPYYEYALGTGWIGSAPPSCSFTGSYTVNAAGWQNMMNDLEKCRTLHSPGALILDVPPGVYNTAGNTIPQTNTTGTHANSPIIVRTSAWQTLESMPEPIGAGGIQANVSASTQIGLRNPSLDGKNLLGLATECPTQSAGAGGLAYQLGESTICIPAGSFTLANGLNPFINSVGVPGCPTGAVQPNTACYNYLQFMPQLVATSTSAPLLACSISTGSALPCGASASFGPDLWFFEGIVFEEQAGNHNNMDLVAVDDRSGNSTSTTQWASHIHFRRDGFLADWANLNVGYNQIATALSLGSCAYCSVVGSQFSQLLRPGAEGHVGALSGVYIKVSNNWAEGQSSCFFTGGGSSAPSITPIGTFVGATDIEHRRTRCTFPLAWLGSPYGPGNVNNADPYWGGLGDNPGQPAAVNVATDGVTVTYVSGPVGFHDSSSSWPGNNVFINGVTNGCWNGAQAVKCKVSSIGAGTFPSSPPTTLTLTNPVCNASCTGALTTGLTNVGFILNGASIVRKNCDEKKSGMRYLESGNFCENVDPSGGQSGIGPAFSNRNCSGGCQGSNYQNTLADFNVQNMVVQNVCEDLTMDAGSAPGGGNGGGSVAPMQRMSFYNIAHLNITSTNPGCAPTGATVGMQVNVGFETWTGTVTENSGNTSSTFVATASTDAGAPLISSTATYGSFSSHNLTINVTSASTNFVANEWVHFPCSGCAGDPGSGGSGELQDGDFQIVSLTSSTLVLSLGSGSTDPVSLNAGAKIQGPSGFQAVNIPDGFPVFLTACTNTAFNGPTTSVAPLASTGGGSTAWTGTYVAQAVGYGTTGTVSVTFPWVATANASTTCTLTNREGRPKNLYVQKNLEVTDAATVFGSGTSPSSGAAYSQNWGIEDNLWLNSGAVAGKAGWFNVAVSLGEGNVTEVFQADSGTLTASNLLIPRPTGAAVLYGEWCNNSAVSLLNCTPSTSNPAHMYFPNSGGSYSSCTVGFVNGCTAPSNIPLALSDPHQYALALTSPYIAAASDGSPLDADFGAIDAAQTANTYVPMVMGQPVTVSVGPFPDSLVSAPPPIPSPTAPAAAVFAALLGHVVSPLAQKNDKMTVISPLAKKPFGTINIVASDRGEQ